MPSSYLLNVLSELTDPIILTDTSTPQGMAFDWLSNDPYCEDPSNCENLHQRYVAALLYYSMQGVNWRYDNDLVDEYYPGENWLSESVECDWWGVYCNSNNEMAG